MTAIHSSAIISPKARVAPGVQIGPHAVIGPDVTLGKGTRIHAQVVIEGHTTLGERCEVFPGACLGMVPQDKKFKTDTVSYLTIGDDNVIRENVTIHVASIPGAATVLGARNYLMVGMHIGHDCVLGDDITIANDCALGGHVRIEDKAVIGGLTGIHQFARIGKLSMVGGKSKVVVDVPPFSVCDGHPARFYGLNSIGLRRAGYSSKASGEIKKALKILFASGLNLSGAMDRVRGEFVGNIDVDYLLDFIDASKRGVAHDDAEEA